MSLDDAFNFVDVESDDILDNILYTEESSRKTSPLWNYVDCKSPAHPGVPVCKKCNYVFSIKSSNTTIERHLLNKHNIIIPKVRKQTTLNFKCIDPWPAKVKLVRDKAVVIWIVDNQQPFSVVENENFIEMMHIFDPRYKIPDRHQIKEMIIDEFNERRSNIGYDLQKISSKVSFTADMWTSTIIRHTGINMVAAITNVLNEFNLAGKALALTTNNESAMLYCVEREDGFGQYMLAASINEKLKEYWLIIDNNITILSILDPQNKISLFEPGELTTNAIAILHEQFFFYLSQKPQSQASLPSTSSREYFRQLKKCHIGVTAETTLPPSPSPDFAEIERYLALLCDENMKALLW
ncbi:zinc finger BED domain-containing protein 1-like [Rhizophagus clarus]|uniref:Zinc finger BED domain-containing protein 1-like n=1 Tax=Rhizophagus clarus TaxID=94130 RepID=A0A8H3KSD6_9GLOM|nr:zinc finger BED domain-containing protein 1-like [Rhizophagus clarus]